jgi:thioredoxin-related protein
MRKIFFAAIFAALLFGADFEWYGYKEGLAEAKSSGKPVMVMISQKGCGMCEYMEDVAFEDPQLAEYIEEHFIPVKLTPKEAKALGFRVFGTPTYYILRPDGTRAAKPLAGGATAKVFLQKLQELRRGL